MKKLYRVREKLDLAGGRGSSNAADVPEPPRMLAMDEALRQINTLPGVLTPLEESDLAGVRGCFLVNDLPFKDGGRRIKTQAVQQIAQLMRGVPFIFNHEMFGTAAIPAGRAFGSVTATAPSGAFWAGPRFYIQNRHPLIDPVGLVAAIDGGTMTEQSIGMYAESFTCSICGEEAGDCDHVPRAMYDGRKCLWEYDQITEAEEFSAVISGAIDGTSYFVAAADTRDGAIDPDELEADAVARAQKRDPSIFERMAKAAEARRQTVQHGLRVLTGIRQAS